MRILFSRIFGKVGAPADKVGGFTSRGAKPMNSYSSPPPPPPPRPPSGGSGGNNNNNNRGGGSGAGGGNGGSQGPDFHCSRQELTRRGYSEDVVNTVTQSGYLSAWATNRFNDAGKQKYGDSYIPEYRKDDYAFKGRSQPSQGDHKILRFHEKTDEADGEWHASIDEMQRKAQLRFNASSHNSVSVAVQKFLDLPKPPNFSSEARFTPTIVEVEISRTRSGRQQVRVEDYEKGISYSNEKSIENLFSWLKFKPGS